MWGLMLVGLVILMGPLIMDMLALDYLRVRKVRIGLNLWDRGKGGRFGPPGLLLGHEKV